uniref:Uncharacterized protein n=1 Tax=Plectus sambesii TaxID=2011161 RepID=A0A914VZU2_9BILA
MRPTVDVAPALSFLVIIVGLSAVAAAAAVVVDDDCLDPALRRIATDVHYKQRATNRSDVVAEIHRRLTTDLATKDRGAWTVIADGWYSVPYYGDRCKLRLGQINYAIYLTSTSNNSPDNH